MFDPLMQRVGEGGAAAVLGALIGLCFGFFAHRSRFCLRSAVIEFARERPRSPRAALPPPPEGSRPAWGGPAPASEGKLTVWLFTFATAVTLTQALILAGVLDVREARQLSARGSLSGALIGGLMFGAGMVLARGCSSRMLVLAAQGNLRALLSGLVFAVTAQSAGSGLLSPLRLQISQWWTIEAAQRDVLATSGLGHWGGLGFGLLWLAAALLWGWRQRVRFWGWAGGIGVGLMVALAWWATDRLHREAFDSVLPVQSLSFTGPAAEALMRVLSPPGAPFTFDLGLVPGVFVGALASALLWREWKLEGFQGGQAMRRYIAGAVLMGFGGMLAGGCAVGAGVSGAAVFTLTAFVTLAGIWLAAVLTDAWVDRRAELGPAGEPSRSFAPGAEPRYAQP